ncbi:hypothetical protein T440DRAFT_284295 [Plenodomus tracheiphilus IPT5]|uniref:Uncharacterized protein n=1 Tax=Plenodomus tracheiphilus IPT5 TaxID=1408161 RepID=A0A6A7ART1_9PLEO|nr:hypothetical protein T440DRAFT_284295 [Plenodomus tracheiphilus IPT5]
MAGSTKKRRTSRSQSQNASSKRIRRQSSSDPAHSEHQTFSAKASRAKSVFRGNQDPYYPRDHAGAASLPTGDDWVFRVKVISSSTDLNNDVFKKAVQGLVKICFPEGVLEQLGIQVLEQHMHEENAPEENVRKMIQIFRAEMAHRVTWMLAEYMDTSEKLEAGVEAIVAASASLHGSKLGDDALGHVLASMRRLRERVPNDSTHRLSDGAALRETIEPSPMEQSDIFEEDANETSASATSASEQSSSEASIPPPRKRKNKSRTRESGERRGAISDYKSQAVERPVPRLGQNTTKISKNLRVPRENKISATWSWDIEPAKMISVNIDDCFPTTADLFAYHALPLAKKKLGSDAKRKALRHEMQDMLEQTPGHEYAKWLESFDKLVSGDREMLTRAEANSRTQSRQSTAATPAPVDVRGKVREQASKALGEGPRKRDRVQSESARVPSQLQIKAEANANLDLIATKKTKTGKEGVTATTASFSHPSKQGDHELHVNSTESSHLNAIDVDRVDMSQQ